MKQERLNMYRIDMKYIRNLHNVDNRVSSHPVEKHKKMKPRADFDKIIDKKGKLIGVLNYNLMIPVEEKQLIKINLKPKSTDSVSDKYNQTN